MAPGFYIDTASSLSITNVQSTRSSSPCIQSATTTRFNSYSYLQTDRCYDSYYSRPQIKYETRKERLIRWRAAFKMFYPKLGFTLIKSEKDELAAYRENYKRRLKFKGQNRNLIL